MTTRQFTRAVNCSKSLLREPCGRGGKCEERGIQSCQRGGEEVGRDGETNGRRNGGRVEEMKEEREKKRGRKGRLKRVCCCHYNHSLTSHEGLHGVIISCYGNIISILQVAEILSESIHTKPDPKLVRNIGKTRLKIGKKHT